MDHKQLVFSSTWTWHHAAAALDSYQILNFQVTASSMDDLHVQGQTLQTLHLDM